MHILEMQSAGRAYFCGLWLEVLEAIANAPHARLEMIS